MAIKPRVLIVDDEKEVRQQFASFLTQRLDCEIIEEADGQKVIDRIGQEEFHVVLLDQHMPGIDGFTILEHIHQKAPQTTVIVITGLGGSAASHKVERLGGIYMAKPVSLKALQLTIERELEKRGGFSFRLP
jgi:DNA-binding NtrC family response regulator